MKYESNFEHICHEIVAFTKENWFEVAVLCIWMSVVFWIIVALFSWW